MARILSLETSTSICSVALHECGALLALAEIKEPGAHAEKLVLLVDEVFEKAGLNFRDLDAVAVSQGPGSYTGLRIGVSTAKGIAYGLDIPLIGINTLQAMAYWGPSQREELALREEIERDVIDFLEIDHVRHQSVASLSYGLQKRVELARALAMRPKILMLDEPVAGMNREETEDMARFILDLQEERGMTILLIEHDMGMVMDISNHVAVLNFGQLIASGTPQHVRNHPDVIEAYLGVRESQTAPGQGA